MKHFLMIAALALAAWAPACSPPFPKELLATIDRTASYDAVRKDPDRYRGAVLMLGGMIVETQNLKEGTRIEVLQKPLDSEGRPSDADETGGRFLILSGQFLDPAVYHRGRLITVVGEGAGQQIRPLGEIEYAYPAVTAKSIHLWSASGGPRFTFGIGVSRGF